VPAVIIVGISSDIGIQLAMNFAKDNWNVYGTHRTYPSELAIIHQVRSIRCDMNNKPSQQKAIKWLNLQCPQWDLIIIAVGTLEPIGTFWDLDDKVWSD